MAKAEYKVVDEKGRPVGEQMSLFPDDVASERSGAHDAGSSLEEYGSSLDWRWDSTRGRWVKDPGWWKGIPERRTKGGR